MGLSDAYKENISSTSRPLRLGVLLDLQEYLHCPVAHVLITLFA